MIESTILWLLTVLAIPEVGLLSVFVISLVSATLLPLGSEPAVFAVVKANGALFWPAILIGTVGNTLGGLVNYGMGLGTRQVLVKEWDGRWSAWLQRDGAKVLLLAWLPVIGDPLCMLAGWLKLPFWSCVLYMAIGKFLRYATITYLLLYVPDGLWRQVVGWF